MSGLKIETIDNNVVDAVSYIVKDGESTEILEDNDEVLYDYGTPPAENANREVVVDLSTIHLYTDVLRARNILDIKQDELLNLENVIYLESPDYENSDVLKDFLSMLDNDLDYIISNKATDVYSDEFKEDIRNMNKSKYLIYFVSPSSNNIRAICQAVQSSHKHPGRVILCTVKEDRGMTFEDKELYEYYSVGQTIVVNGSKFFMTLEDLANFINNN